MAVTLEEVPFDAAVARVLVAEQEAETIERYGGDFEPGAKPAGGDLLAFVVARDAGGTALACGGLRRLDSGAVEIKRMYVRPGARGRGLGRAVLGWLEDRACTLGFGVVRLETGGAQPEAIALYESAGYARIPCFGPYAGAPMSICFERRL